LDQGTFRAKSKREGTVRSIHHRKGARRMSELLGKLKRWILAEEGGQVEKRGHVDVAAPEMDRPEQIVVTRPRTLEEAHSCAGYLKEQRTVVVNLGVLEQHLARRALDFLGGVVYAIDGQMEEAGEAIYVLTPTVMMMSSEAAGRQAVQLGWQEHASLQ